MKRTVNNHRLLIAMAIVVAVVAVLVPTCRMIGCNMEMGGGMSPMHNMGAVFSQSCGGEYFMNESPTGIVPSGADSVTIALLAAVAAAVVLFRPQPALRPVRFVDESPPPPPDDSWGERFRL